MRVGRVALMATPVRALASIVTLVLSVIAMPGARTQELRREATGPHPRAQGPVAKTWLLRGIRGRVTDENGRALAGAEVRALLAQGGRSFPMGRARSLADGSFGLSALPEGSYWLVSTLEGYARSATILRLTARDAEGLRVSLAPASRIAGTISTLGTVGAERFAGAVLHAVREGAEAEPGFAVRADREGGFVFGFLPRGTYRIEVNEPGFESLRRLGVSSPSEGLNLSVRALATLEGFVRNARGEGERGARVVLAGSGLWPARSVAVRDDGRFQISGLAAGVYELRASAGDDVAEPVAPLILEPGVRRELTLNLSRGEALSGTVLDAATGRAIAGARVVLVEDALSTAPRALSTDAAGGFRVSGLLRRAHQVSVRAEGYAPRTGIQARPGAEAVSVALERAVTVSGQVIDARGEPVSHAQVELTVRDLEGRPTWLSGSSVAFREALFAAQARGPSGLFPAGELGVTHGRVPIVPTVALPVGVTAERVAPGFVTDAYGRFEILEVPPGLVTLAVSHPLYVRGESEGRLARAGERLDLTLNLYSGATLEGRVLTERGFPVGSVLIEVRSASDLVARRVFSERDGTFRVPTVLGHVALVAFLGARVGARAELDVADGAVVSVTLTLPGALRRVEGRVLDARGFPVEGASVTLTSLEREALGAATTLSQRDGTFDTVTGGRGGLQITVRHPRFAMLSTRAEDFSRPLRLELSEGVSLALTPRGDGCATGAGWAELRSPCGPVGAAAIEGEALTFERLCGGRSTLIIDLPGCLRAERTVTLERPHTELGRVDLLAGGGASGEVVDSRGEPVSGCLVVRDGGPSQSSTETARTGRGGEFTVGNLPVGESALVAIHPTLGRSRPSAVRVLRGTVARGLRVRFEAELSRDTRAVALTSVTVVTTRLGVEVRAVTEDSEAQRAGLRAGDRVLSVAGVAVTRAEQVERAMRGGPTDDVVMELEREGVRRAVRFRRGM